VHISREHQNKLHVNGMLEVMVTVLVYRYSYYCKQSILAKYFCISNLR